MLYNFKKRGGAVTVYIDIIFLENICMNYIILLATGVIIKSEIKHLKILLGSILGSMYAVIYYITKFEIYSSIALKILLSIAMVYIAYKPKCVKQEIKYLVIFYLASFAFGGCAFALLYFIKPQNILIKNGVFVGTYPLKIAILGGIIGFVIVVIAFKIIKGKRNKRNLICKINIRFENNSKTFRSLIDTGNLLKEPITGNLVIVAETDELKEIVPDEILSKTQNIMYENTNIDEKYISKIRLIPFSSLGMPNGMLVGIKADEVKAYWDDEEYVRNDVIIGIYNKKLSKNNSYNALVGIELFEKT